jgi:hypothetical protein
MIDSLDKQSSDDAVKPRNQQSRLVIRRLQKDIVVLIEMKGKLVNILVVGRDTA